MRDLGSCKRRAKRRAQAAIIAAALGFGAQNVASVAPSISNGLFENRAIFGAESAQTANRPMTAQAAKENRPTEFKAFFVGVHNYAEATDLPYAKKDVEDLAARFVEIGFKEKNVTVLKVDDKLGFDNWPTQKNIEARFGEFVNSLEKGDFAVLYLSGHGFQNDAGEAYFAPTDVTADNPFGTSVSIDWMLERLGESDADFCWAIVDACRNNLKEDGAKTPRQMFTGVRSFGPKDLAADFKNAPKTVSILRSCTPGQCSYEGGDGVENGLFTRALLEAFDPNNLKANGADGDLRFFEIISYVMKRTEELADACGVKQNPVEGGQAERSDFTLLTGLPTSEEEPAELIVKGEEGETGGSSGTSTIWILLAVGGAAGGAFWLRRNPERVKAALEKTKAFATSVASSRGVGKRIQEVKKRNEKAKLASVNGLLDEALKACETENYKTARDKCEEALREAETSDANETRKKADDARKLLKEIEKAASARAKTLYGEALKAYNAEDYATARAKCEESLKAKQTPEALKLRPEIETAATKRANELFEEALRFYVAENYATANVKCQASLAAKETPEALALQPKIESALLEEEAKAARAKEALDEARKAFGQGDYKTARDRCEASLAEVETSEARILLEKIKEAERAKAAALEKAKALYDEALSAYDSGDYKTARRKCEASLKEAETSDAFDLKKTLDEDAAKRAKTLFDEALRAYDSKDYPTAQRKCEASLEEAETVGARELLKMLKAARRVQEAEAATILKRANKALDEARRARDKRDYKTARVKCEEALKEAEKLNTDELRKKANEARELSRGLETIAKATANALYDEAFKAYRERDYATARRKCEESLNAFEMSATRELRREIDDAEKADAAAREAQAKRLCDEAFKAGDVGDYATARRKCEESLKAAETSAARDAAEAARKTKTPSRDRSTSAAFGWGAVYEAGTRKTLSAAGIEYALRYCPAQTFWMGSPANEEGRADDETLRKVTLTRGFWILETPVTQAMWTSIMGKNPSEFPASGSNALKFPVENVSWFDCLDFINKLNATVNLSDGLALRLPTEAEWEAACRAGTDGPYAGLRLDDLGWYFNNSGSRTRAVKTKAANPWGVSDMHGNVLEWCWDWMAPCDATSATDPKGPNKGTFRVLRGGGWCSLARCCRSAHRDGLVPSNRSGDSGFRLVLGSRF